METGSVIDLKTRLMQSHWPKCDELAQALASIGGQDARKALIEALKAKRHHIRTAAIKALVGFGDESLVPIIENLLNDPSYETRMQAKATIKRLAGRDVLTGRGE